MSDEELEALLGESVSSHDGVWASDPVGVRIARKHLAWYSKGLPGSAEFRADINRMNEPAEVRAAVRRFYTPLIERLAA